MQALMHLYALQCGRHLVRPRGHVPLMHLTFYVVTVRYALLCIRCALHFFVPGVVAVLEVHCTEFSLINV